MFYTVSLLIKGKVKWYVQRPNGSLTHSLEDAEAAQRYADYLTDINS